jgi:APA family basic amino acid/polyamine antiporter
VGYVAGWASLLVGFAGPIAIDAIAAGCFLQTIFPVVQPKLVGVVVILGLTMLHAFDLSLSKWTQNWLVSVKVLLVIMFVVLGLSAGSHILPDWSPPAPSEGFPLAPFMASLFYIAFAFSGWNAAVYAVEEFEKPKQDVPRAMFIGCLVVALLYLLVNWVFVANINPEKASIVFSYDTEKITLGHVLMSDLIGDVGGKIMSGFLVVAFLSATSAMIFAGPRVYAAMAKDGYLPSMLQAKEGKPPVGSVLLQGAISLIILFTQNLQDILHDIGAILTLFSALTAASLLWVCYKRRGSIAVSPVKMTAAVVFIISTAYMFYFGLQANTNLLLWIVIIGVVASFCYYLSRRFGGAGKA